MFYVIMAVITAIVSMVVSACMAEKKLDFHKDSDDLVGLSLLCVLCGTFWPFVLCIGLVFGFMLSIMWLITKINHKIYK